MKESGLFLPSTYDVEFAGHAPRRLASGERLDAGADNGRRDAKPSRMDFRKALAHVRQEIEGGRNGTLAAMVLISQERIDAETYRRILAELRRRYRRA